MTVIADAAERLDALGDTALAAELRTIRWGRPPNIAHLQRLAAIHRWMHQKIAEGVSKESVLKSAQERHKSIDVDWESVLTLQGRPDIRAVLD